MAATIDEAVVIGEAVAQLNRGYHDDRRRDVEYSTAT